MKTLLRGLAAAFLVVGLTGIAPSAHAQKGASTKPMNFTPAQKQKFQLLEQEAMQQAQAIQNGPGTPAQKQAKLMAMSQKLQAQALSMMTPSQRAEAGKRIAAARQKQAEAMAIRKKFAARSAAVKKSLTPAQRSKITAIDNEFKKNMMSLQSDKNLTPLQRQQKVQEYVKDHSSKVDFVLTPQQRATLYGM